MKSKKQQNYVTLSAEGALLPAEGRAQQDAGGAPAPDASDVAYRLARVAEEASSAGPVAPNALDAADMSQYTAVPGSAATSLPKPAASEAPADARPRALVMSHGKGAKRMLQAASDAGFQAWAPCTQDRRHEAHLKLADGNVSLGERYSDALFANSYAVLAAARECGASVVLLADEALALAEVDSFLARAAARGIRVFRPMNADAPLLGWILCATDRPAPPEDAWRACPHCGLMFDTASLAAGHYACPSCGGYFRMSSDERIDDTLDADSFVEWDAHVPETDPLGFPGYAGKLAAQRAKTGLDEAVRTGMGRIAGLRVAVGIMESQFFMGSMGSVVGEKLARLVERATDERLPVVVFTASGGARMQEGLVSLMQMAKVSCALSRHAEAGLPYFSVLTDPTTGGVTASFAMQGDIVLAEPGALVGFAGQRVIKDTIKQELPEGFQTAEFALEHGLVDAIVERGELRSTLAHLLALHAPSRPRGAHEPGDRDILVTYEAVCENLASGAGTYNAVTYGMLPVRDSLADAAGWRRPRSRSRLAALASKLDVKGARADKRLEKALSRGGFDAEGGASLEGADGTAADVADGSNAAWRSVPAGAQHAPADGTLLPRALGGRVRGAARRPGVRRRRRGGRGPGLAGGTPRHGHRAGEGRRPEGTHRAQLRLPAAGRLPQVAAPHAAGGEVRPPRGLPGGHPGRVLRHGGGGARPGQRHRRQPAGLGRPARSGGKRASGGRRQRRGPCARACRPRGHAESMRCIRCCRPKASRRSSGRTARAPPRRRPS